jgi:hypothetical protein
MSIDAADLISLAQRLAMADTECEWRSGASRAYYAAYHKTLNAANRCVAPLSANTGYHERLTDRLMEYGNKGKSIAYELIELKKERTRADYELDEQFSQRDATKLVSKSVNFLPKVDAFEAYVASCNASMAT